jgi:hypothetical protein
MVTLAVMSASRKLRNTLGSSTVVTPVRRSLRTAGRTPRRDTAPVDVAALLSSSQYAFAPNEAIGGGAGVMLTPAAATPRRGDDLWALLQPEAPQSAARPVSSRAARVALLAAGTPVRLSDVFGETGATPFRVRVYSSL